MSRTTLGGLAVLTLLLTGCGDVGSPDTSGGKVTGDLTVFAAASLTEPFTMIGEQFETGNLGVTVTFSFAGSSTLATQINNGAPADVFASAAPANMATVTDAGNTDGSPTIFVKNQLVIAVPDGNPKGITGLGDLTEDVLVAMCAEQVPCGAAAKRVLDASGVALTPATLENDVKGALSKLKLGEVDAALVYRSDVTGESEVEGVEFPASAEAVNDYPIAVLKESGNKAAAEAFVDYVLSAEGQAVLAGAGFQAP